jgi:hypothetical protein
VPRPMETSRSMTQVSGRAIFAPASAAFPVRFGAVAGFPAGLVAVLLRGPIAIGLSPLPAGSLRTAFSIIRQAAMRPTAEAAAHAGEAGQRSDARGTNEAHALPNRGGPMVRLPVLSMVAVFGPALAAQTVLTVDQFENTELSKTPSCREHRVACASLDERTAHSRTELFQAKLERRGVNRRGAPKPKSHRTGVRWDQENCLVRETGLTSYPAAVFMKPR